MPSNEDFDPKQTAKTLLREVRSGALGTLMAGAGVPFCTLVNVATDLDGAPIILTSRLSAHTANLDADTRASILLAETGKGDPLAHPRLTVIGAMERLDRASAEGVRARRRFLARHPKSELYADFADFGFWRMQVASAHLNGGFARAADLIAADVLTDLTGAEAMIEIEEGAVAHMNADHAEAIRLYAVKLLGAREGQWRATGIDPEGIDLALGDATLRLHFPQRVVSPERLRAVLKQLADSARTD
jgi:putative heme iron utilization protein